MKNQLFLILGIFTLSGCSESDGERMLREYQKENVKALNFELEDLEFEIESVERTQSIIASDSMALTRYRLAELWENNPNQTLVDTISFEFVKSELNTVIVDKDTLQKMCSRSILKAVEFGDAVWRMESEIARDKARKERNEFRILLTEVELLEAYFNALAEKPDSVLSVKYVSKYRIKNPLLGNAVQTFNKVFYSNAAETSFVKEEELLD
jgi:hypothetical protein